MGCTGDRNLPSNHQFVWVNYLNLFPLATSVLSFLVFLKTQDLSSTPVSMGPFFVSNKNVSNKLHLKWIKVSMQNEKMKNKASLIRFQRLLTEAATQLLLALLGDRFICLSGFGLPCSTAELHPPTELLSLSGIFRSSPEPKWMGPLANMKQIWPWHGPCNSKVPINSMEKKRETNKHVLLASQSLQVFFSHSFNHFSRWDVLLEIIFHC